MTSPSILEISPDARGRWLVETASGSRHVIDLDALTYSRHSLNAPIVRGLDDGAPRSIAEVETWPRVNSVFRLGLDAGTGEETHLTSTYVTRIRLLRENEKFDVTLPPQTLLEEVAQAPPTNAWLLMGDSASFPTTDELVAQQDPLNDDLLHWTSPRQIVRGDLVFMYFMAPHKAIHFAARARFPPVYDSSLEVNANRPIDAHQWWTDLTPFVEVPVTPFKQLQEFHDGHLVLRGKPTHYLTPTVVKRLMAGFGDLDGEQQAVLQTPTGDANLPDPATMQPEDLRRIASGALKLEAMVEQYVVEPLLRMCFPTANGHRIEKQVRIPNAGVADYGVYDEGELRGVVEVKLGIQRRRDGKLRGSPDLEQVLRYASASGVPALLIDSNEIVLVDPMDSEPIGSFDRSRLNSNHLDAIAAHFQTPGTK